MIDPGAQQKQIPMINTLLVLGVIVSQKRKSWCRDQCNPMESRENAQTNTTTLAQLKQTMEGSR